MAHEILAATNAVVTLDVALPGIVWPWFVTMNMWAKSIGTGVIFMLFYLLKKYTDDKEVGGLRLPVAFLSVAFITIFLLFTLADLHQPFRMWHIFFYPHFTSAITVGAIMASVFMGLISVLFLLSCERLDFIMKNNDELYDKILTWTTALAVPVTLYTAALLSECTARELWQMPTESAQMILAATLSGSATILLVGYKLSYEAKRDMGIILAFSAFSAFTLYMSELVFGPMKAEEVQATIAFITHGGEWQTAFWVGQSFAYIIPFVLVLLSLKSKSESIMKLAAISALAGLFVVKHVWLVIPQLLSMS
jgi:Ni/Fe-hydrogenase subunit HybB-like protein